jgi:hypothetical protein
MTYADSSVIVKRYYEELWASDDRLVDVARRERLAAVNPEA